MKKEFTSYYCNKSYVNVILPSDKIKKDKTSKWLIIGYPGVDGIEFRTKVNDDITAIFAYYPIEGTYIKVADSDKDLIEKWESNKLIL